MLIIGLGLLSMLYFAASYVLFHNVRLRDILKKKANIQKPSASKTVLFIFTGLSLSIILIGLLFSIMIWTGAIANIILGFFSGLLCLAFILYGYVKGDKTYRWILYRTIPIVILAGVFYISPNTWINYHYDFDHKSRDLLIEMQENPNDTSVSNEFRSRMDFYRDSCNNAEFSQ